MGFGKSKPDLAKETISVRRKIENKRKEETIPVEIPKPNETINIDIEIDEIEEEFALAISEEWYRDNPNAERPDEFMTDVNGFIQPKPILDIKGIQRAKGKILINQSLITRLIDKYGNEVPFCPFNIKKCIIDRQCKDIPTDSMLKGKYFESMCLGGTTGGNMVTDLPRKKLTNAKIKELTLAKKPLIGEKTIDHIRIDNLIDRFKLRAKELKVEIVPGVNNYVTILKACSWDDKYMFIGELDLFPTGIIYEDYYRRAIIDLKLTEDVNSTFGKFCWGTPQHMDMVQADMYHFLVRDIDFELNSHLKELVSERTLDIIKNDEILFVYWVWGYKKDPKGQEKIIERAYKEHPMNNYRQSELKERIKKVIYVLEREAALGWSINPIPEVCSKCSMNVQFGGECQSSVYSKV